MKGQPPNSHETGRWSFLRAFLWKILVHQRFANRCCCIDLSFRKSAKNADRMLRTEPSSCRPFDSPRSISSQKSILSILSIILPALVHVRSESTPRFLLTGQPEAGTDSRKKRVVKGIMSLPDCHGRRRSNDEVRPKILHKPLQRTDVASFAHIPRLRTGPSRQHVANPDDIAVFFGVRLADCQ